MALWKLTYELLQVVVTTEQAVVASLSIELDGELLHAVRTPVSYT